MRPPFFRTPFNHDAMEFSNECSVKDFGESLTVQSMSEDADINVIMKRYGVTGKMPEDGRVPEYQDFEDIFDFQSAQNAVIAGQRAFDAYPWELRARFSNSPQRFLEFCADPANIDEMRKLGLARKQEKVDGSSVSSVAGAAASADRADAKASGGSAGAAAGGGAGAPPGSAGAPGGASAGAGPGGPAR